MKPSSADARRGPASSGIRGRLRGVPVVALGSLLIVFLISSACASHPPGPAEPMVGDASEAFLSAWRVSRQPGFATDDVALAEAVESAERALALQPEWAAPARFIDEWRYRPALTLPASYARHLVALESGDATAAYLAGRLGGEAGGDLMRRCVEIDPANGWGWHGLGWMAFLGNDLDGALRLGSRAAGLARDPHELALFSWALARYLRASDQFTEASGVLEAALDREGALALRPLERIYIEAELAMVELRSDDDADVRRGVARGLALIGRPGLTEVERSTLATMLVMTGGNLVTRTEVAQRLLASSGAGEGDAAAAVRILVDRVLSFPAASAWEDPSVGSLASLARGEVHVTRQMLVNAFASGETERIGETFAAWQAGLPAHLRTAGDESVVRHDALRKLGAVLVADPADSEDAQVAAALLDAGWFLEALGFARACRERSPEVARSLEERALRGRATLDGLLQLALRLDAREAFLRAGASGSLAAGDAREEKLTSLRELRDEIVAMFRRTGLDPSGAGQTGGGEDDRVDGVDGGSDLGARPDAEKTPVIKYGPLGGIVHPGVTYSAEDEAQGRGIEGTDVPGMAALFRSINRFALVGDGAGQGGPDATVLRIVFVEERSGVHAGRPFQGTVFWCEGADVPGRFGRLGAGISGAALHEGYYLDIEQIALERERWVAVGKRFRDADKRTTALAVTADTGTTDRRAEIGPALGAGDRMRLVVFDALAKSDGSEFDPFLRIDVLTHVVATHEEGHLCDRAQWYPLSFRRVMRLIAFAGAHGFSGQRIAQALEERAQLVALCACDDPRVPLIDLLDAAESGVGTSLTPHAAAYRRLLKDLLTRLEREVQAGEWDGKGLDLDVRWIDQLHRFAPEDLRGLALREAKARGLAGGR